MAGIFKIKPVEYTADGSGNATVPFGNFTGVLLQFMYESDSGGTPTFTLNDDAGAVFDLLNGEGAALSSSTRLSIDADFPLHVVEGNLVCNVTGAGAGGTGTVTVKVAQK